MALLAPAGAQSLQRLHVRTLTLSSDTLRPQLEHPFHLVVRATVAESLRELRNVQLPMFSGLEMLGDERRIAAQNGATVYVETLTVVPHQSGAIDVSPAYVDAIDARDGRPKRFISNALRLQVAPVPLFDSGSTLRAIVGGLVRAVLGLVALAALLLLAIALFVKRRAAPHVVASPASAPPAEASHDPWQSVIAAARDVQRRRSRVSVEELRDALRDAAGVPRTATLRQTIAREPDPRRRRLYECTEIAAFVDEPHFTERLDELLAELRWIE